MSRKTLVHYRYEMNKFIDLYRQHPSPYLHDKAQKAKAAYQKQLNKETAAAKPKPTAPADNLFSNTQNQLT